MPVLRNAWQKGISGTILRRISPGENRAARAHECGIALGGLPDDDSRYRGDGGAVLAALSLSLTFRLHRKDSYR